MSKYEVKQLIAIIVLFLIDIAVAYLITCSLGIQNTVLIHSYSATTMGEITWEVLLLWLFLLIETPIFNKIDKAIE